MPIYEYRCEKGHTFEVMQRMSDDPVVVCETCSAPVQRVFHPIAVHFKGSGFYSTDYGSRNRARELKEAGEGAGKYAKDGAGANSSSSKSESGSGSSSDGSGSSSDGSGSSSDGSGSSKSGSSDSSGSSSGSKSGAGSKSAGKSSSSD